MTREEHALFLKDILDNPGDVAVISTNLAALSEDYAITLAQKQAAEVENVLLKKTNASLVAANSALFLKVGNVPEKEAEPEEEVAPTFAALFDESGELM